MTLFPPGIGARGSFKRQIILAFVVGFFLLIATFSSYLLNSEREELYRDSNEVTTGLAASLAVSSLSWVLANDLAGLQEVAGSFQKYPELRYAMVISPSGRVLAHSDATKVGQFVSDEQSLALIKSPPGQRIVIDDAALADVAVPVSINGRLVGWARVGLGRGKISDDLRKMKWSNALFVLSATALALLAALLIAGRLGSRIGALVKVAEDVQAGNVATRVGTLGGEDEITKLADTFNQMLDALALNEERLRSASLYTRSLIEASLDPLVTISPEGKITDLNRATEVATGRSRLELIGTDFSDCFAAPEKARTGYQEAFKKGAISDLPLVLQHRDGHVTHMLYNASVYRNEKDEVLGVFAAARDVTEQKRAEMARSRLAAIVESSSDAIIGKTLDGVITSWNRGAEKIYGYCADEIIGKPITTLAPALLHVEIGSLLGNVRKGEAVVNHETERIRKDGTRFHVALTLSPIWDDSGNISGISTIARDITGRKRAEDELRRLSLFQRTILDNVAYGVISTRPDGIVTSFNPAAERLLGYTASDVVGQQTPARWHDPEEIARHALLLSEELGAPIAPGFEVFAARPRRNLPEENEWTFIRKDGTRIPVNLSVTALRAEGGQITGFVGLTYDLTERKLDEQVLQRLNRELRAISNCNQTLMRAEDEPTLLTEICQIVCEQAGYRMAWVGYAENDEAKSVRPVAWAGVEDGYLAQADIIWADAEPGRGPAGSAIRSGESSCLQDFSSDPTAAPWQDSALQRGYRSCISLPLKNESQNTFGVFTIYATEPNAFTPSEVRLLEELAGDLAFGITVLRTRNERKRVEENLLRMNERYSLSTHAAGLGVWDWDLQKDELVWDDRMYELYGVKREDFAGAHEAWLKGIHPDDRAASDEASKQARRGEREYDTEFRVVWPDGSDHCLKAYGQLVRDADGKPIRMTGVNFDITEIKQAEASLRDSEEKYRTLIQKIQAAVIVHGPDTKILTSNSMAQQILGLSQEQLLGKTAIDPAWHFFREDGTVAPSDEYPVSRVLASRKTLRNYILGVHRPDQDNDAWVLVNADPVFGKENELTQIIVTFIDISERKHVESLLSRSEHEYRTLAENSPDVIVRYDRQGRRIYVNPEFERVNHLTSGQVLGKTPAELSTSLKPKADVFTEQLMAAMASGRPAEIDLSWTLDGKPVCWFVRVVPEFDAAGKVTSALTIWSDISERKQAEEEIRRLNAELEQRVLERTRELAESEERMRQFFERQLVGMAITSPEKGWVEVNDKICEMLGYSRDELTRLSWAEMTYPEDLAADVTQFERVLSGEIDSYMLEKRFVRKDGSLVFTNLAVGCVRRADRSVDYVLALLEDITERKHAEESIHKLNQQLLLARDAAEAANKAKSVFLANMSHELRTPLNAILGFSSLMRKDPLLQHEQRENLDIINRSGEHLLTLINDVLEMAKIEAGRVQVESAPFDLGSLVRDVTDMMHVRAKEKGLRLLIDQSSQFPRYIRGDEGRVRQVMINLLGNAVKFTQHGGVTVRFGLKPHATPQRLLIEVEDSGIGICAEDQKKVFEPFVQFGETAAQKGTGLGLSIARQFVQLMGGTISFESTLGKGSIFRVELPMEKVAADDVLRPHSAGGGEIVGLAPGQPEYRILIVEDQLDNQLLLTRLMKNVGFQVKVAENGEQALGLFGSWRPHLIWMDRRMPVMDGLEATRRIRKLPGGREVKIVAVTASVFTEQRDEMLKAGMDDFVRKPYRFNEIYESMARQLGVQYTYAEAPPEDTVSEVMLTSQMLAVLPADLRHELREALESLEGERITTVVGKVAAYDLVVHQTLSRLVGNFDYPAILKVLQMNDPAGAA